MIGQPSLRLSSDGLHSRSLPSVHLVGLAAVSFLVLLCGVIELTGIASSLPPLISGTLGAALFASAPGFLLFSYLCLFQSHHYGGLTLFLISISLSFTSNFLFNVVAFAVKPDLGTAYAYYFLLIFIANAAIVGLMIRRDNRFLHRVVEALRSQRRSLLLIAAGAVALIVSLELKANPGLLVEEAFILRKIAELPTIEIGNLSLMPNTPTTYVFVPFYLFLGLVSKFSQLDIVGTIFAVGPYLTLVAFCLTLKLLLLISHDRRVIACFVPAFIWVLIAIPLRSGNYHTAIVPSIDRYGIAEGLLLPLAIFHYVMHLRDKQTNIAMLVGLIYLIVEVSFVHGRETLCFLAFALAHLCVLAGIGRSRSELRRGAFILVVVASILAIYREVALSQAPELLGFVKSMSSIMYQSLAEIIRNGNVAAFLGYKPPNVMIDVTSTGLAGLAAQGVFFPIVGFVVLPLYAVLADNPLRLSICLTAAASMLFSTMTGLQLAIGAIVGSWYVLEIKSFMALLFFLILVDFLVQMTTLIERAVSAFRSAPELHEFLLSKVKATFNNPKAPKALVGAICFALLAMAGPRPLISWTYGITILSLAGLILRIRTLRRSAVSPEIAGGDGRRSVRVSLPIYGVLLTCISAFGFLQWVIQPVEGIREVHRTPPWTWRTSCARSDVLEVFDCLNKYQLQHIVWYKTGVGSAPLPRELLQFFRHEIAAGKTIFGTETLPILMTAPVYSPAVTYSSRFLGNFVTNDTVFESIQKAATDAGTAPDHFRISLLFSTPEGRELMDRVLESYAIDFVVIGPQDYGNATKALRAAAGMRHRFRPVFDHAEYLVLAVDASSRPGRASGYIEETSKAGE